jgi:hypothetical protein
MDLHPLRGGPLMPVDPAEDLGLFRTSDVLLLAAGTIALAVASLRGHGAISEFAADRSLREVAELRARAALLEELQRRQHSDVDQAGYDNGCSCSRCQIVREIGQVGR